MSVTVSSLIADTQWSPPKTARKAKVSVLLPVYRRNADGMLSKCIDSILNQTYADLELIVIDDASTDGSAETVAAYMARDGRVGCLTHPRNIGLPAVSEFEGLEKATGDYILCAFDDFVFSHTALEVLVDYAESHPGTVPHGYVKFPYGDYGSGILGRAPKYDDLLISNVIANASVLFPIHVIEDIGFYDPHIISSRLCDWDLLRRIRRSYQLAYVDVFVGTEFGAARSDSLGSTYPIFTDATELYFCTERNERLTRSSFRQFDVLGIPAVAGAAVSLAVEATGEHFATKWWYPKDDGDRPYSIAVLGELDASTMLLFEGLSEHPSFSVVYVGVSAAKPWLNHLLNSVDLLVVTRQWVMDPLARTVILQASQKRVPVVYYLDDNFMVLAKSDSAYARFSDENMTAGLAEVAAVIAMSEPLAAYIRDNKIHEHVSVPSPVFSEKRYAKCQSLRGENRTPPRLRVGFIGGMARFGSLENQIVPALLERLGAGTFELFVRKGALVGVGNVKVTEIDQSGSYDEFLSRWSELKIDILIHTPVESDNLPYKADGTLLISTYIGAVPILPDEPAFRGLSQPSPIKIAGSASEYAEAVAALIAPEERARQFNELVSYARMHFSLQRSLPALRQALTRNPPLTRGSIWRKLRNQLDTPTSSIPTAISPRALRLALWIQRFALKLKPLGIMRLVRLFDRV